MILPNQLPNSQEAGQPQAELPQALGISGAITPNEFKQRINESSEEEFALWLLTINASVRNVEPATHSFDGESYVEGLFGLMPKAIFKVYCPPEPEDRLPLLMEGLRIAQGVEDPMRAGAVLSVGINFAHIHADGNGRTGRVIYELASAGYNGEEDNQRYNSLLANGASDLSINHQYLSNTYLAEYSVSKQQSIAASHEYTGLLPDNPEFKSIYDTQFCLPPIKIWDRDYWLYELSIGQEARTNLKALIDDPPDIFRELAVFDWLLETGQADQYIRYSDEVKAPLIAYGDLLANLSDADILSLTQKHKEVRRDFVRFAMQTTAERGIPDTCLPQRREESELHGSDSPSSVPSEATAETAPIETLEQPSVALAETSTSTRSLSAKHERHPSNGIRKIGSLVIKVIQR